jgi:citronellyl-CoA dehydrogenase
MYSSEHFALMDTVKRFCESEINPYARAWEEKGMFPAHELFKKMGALGLLGINKPQEHGGSGLDYTYQLAFAEAMGASTCPSVNLAVCVQTDMATPALALYGSCALKEEFLRPTIAGDYVACLGVSEVEAGSDIAAIKTSARRDGDDYVIQGGKMWTTNGVQADWICLLCNTDERNSLLSKSLICVPLNLPGISVGRPFSKLGMSASDTTQIHFDGVRVPVRYLIGQAGRGMMYQMRAFLDERISAAASGLLMMERILDQTIEHTRSRRTFGRPLISNQSIQFKIAELKTKIELLRSLVYRTVAAYVNGEDVTRLVCMGKLTAGRLQREVADSCLQYFGGMGFMNETEVSRFYRDSRLVSIGGGSDEMMLSMICRTLGILPSPADEF